MNEELELQLLELNNELVTLLDWFAWYDTQPTQHDRDIRLRGSSDIDLLSLDLAAEEKKVRIKELRKEIKDLKKKYYEGSDK